LSIVVLLYYAKIYFAPGIAEVTHHRAQ